METELSPHPPHRLTLFQFRASVARRLSPGCTVVWKHRRILLSLLFCTLSFIILAPGLGALWVIVGVLPMEILYSTHDLAIVCIEVLVTFLVAAAAVSMIGAYVTARIGAIAVGSLVAASVFLISDLDYLLLAPGGKPSMYGLYVIGYGLGGLLLASFARICIELQDADRHRRTRFLLGGAGVAALIGALYALWLLPLPTYVALTVDDWRHAMVTLRPDRVLGALPGFVRLPEGHVRFPEGYEYPARVAISVKRFAVSNLFSAAGAETVRVQTWRARPIVICWPYWLQIQPDIHNTAAYKDGRTCLPETIDETVTIRGNTIMVSAGLTGVLQEADALYIPNTAEVTIIRHPEDRHFMVISDSGGMITTEGRRLEALVAGVGELSTTFPNDDDLLADLRELAERYRDPDFHNVVIQVDSERYKLKPRKDSVIDDDDRVVMYLPQKKDGRVSIVGGLRSVVEIDTTESANINLNLQTLASNAIEGKMKLAGNELQIDHLDEVFIGGHSLHMRTTEEGGLEIYGKATHVVVNGRVMWKSIAQFVPSEVWAAIIGATVSFILSVVLVRGRMVRGMEPR